MSSERDRSGDARLTQNRETIREWVDTHNETVTPVRTTRSGTETVRIVRDSDRATGDEELTWDEFYSTVEEEDHVVVYHDAGGGDAFEVLPRDEAMMRTTVENETLEERLIEGEVVTTRVTETTVIERTVVEEATIESEVVDRQAVEEEFVDAEFVTRQVDSCEVTAPETAGAEEPATAELFETGYRTTEGLEEFGVDVTVTEDWTVTKELLEQLTIESRVIDVDVTETDTVEDESVEATVGLDSVRESILQSGILDSDVIVDDFADSEAVRTEYTEDDVITTQLFERKTVEEEMTLDRHLTGALTEAETRSARSAHREVVESEVVEADREFVEPSGAAMGTATGATADEMGDVETTETAEMGAGEAATGHAMPDADDEGKTVVDESGDEVGTVVKVEGDTLYVDPHRSLTQRIEAALGWDEMDEEAYPITSDRIRAITDDRVEVAGSE